MLFFWGARQIGAAAGRGHARAQVGRMSSFFGRKVFAGILGEEYVDESPKGRQWILAVGKEGQRRAGDMKKKRVFPPFGVLLKL